MKSCPSCSAENAEESKFCSECGAALSPEYEPTQIPASSDSSQSFSSDSSSHHGRFLPGTKIADRYRIVSLVGKGGMGEVYRADDLKLGQTVALKFLPRDLADDPQRLEYFHSEVRLTRQISHPNVCRVYDIGEFDGQQFLSMEYIDGEDLRVLLRRIGRLPGDKGVQVAQQLCAGLAAAHDKGVLHRDLKPANIMIDGRGHVRITDFGLARLVGDDGDGEVAGTPAYMAPEQLTRGKATIQSDLFALGLILSEIFTGEPVLKPGSIPELIRSHESSLPQTLKLSDDVDPLVQSVIHRCLEREPYERPASARVVAAGLPGGDPLAAALAAGETPSPEMVAASGETGLLSLKTAGIWLAVGIAGLAILLPIINTTSPANGVDRELHGYAERAQTILEELGLNNSDGYVKFGFAKTAEEPERMEFWYRQSEQELVPLADLQYLRYPAVNSLVNPPPVVPGMVSARLHRDGTLRELLVMDSEDLADSRKDVSETQLLQLAKLIPTEADSFDGYFERDPTDPLEPTNKKFKPPIFADKFYSFIPFRDTNTSSADSDFSLREDIQRVDVAEVGGHVVFFHVVDDTAPKPRTVGAIETRDSPFGVSLTLILTLTMVVLAWRNVIAGRSDLRGARRLALCVFVIRSAETFCRNFPHPGMLMAGEFLALFSSAEFWVCYVAVEPLARRYWPEMMVTWSRALAGRVQDPGVGRDILYGTVIGILFSLFAFGLLSSWYAPATDPETLCGLQFLLSQLMICVRAALGIALSIAVVMVLVRALSRHRWPAIIAGTMIVVVWHYNIISATLDGPSYAAKTLAYTGYYLIAALLLARLGVLAAASFMLCHPIFMRFPWVWDGPALAGTLFALTAILVCAGYGFYVAIGGRAAFAGGDQAIA